MPKAQQISRRTWLAKVALGGFAVWSELNFGLGRKGWGVAIGDRDLGEAERIEAELRNGSRRGRLPQVAADIVRGLVQNYGMPIADVARQVRISTSGASKILIRGLPIPTCP
jgi:hypothetical protein